MNTKLVTVWCVTATLITACAGNIPFLSTSTRTPTSTPTPTITPTPTSTPRPTWTPTPTRIPRPGIDTYVEIRNVDGDSVSVQFTKVIVTDRYYNPEIVDYHINIQPGMGQTWLIMEGIHKGSMSNVFTPGIKLFEKPGSIYVEGQGGQKSFGLSEGYRDNTAGTFVFAVMIPKTDKGPYKFINTVAGWQVDLSSILDTTPYVTPTSKP